MRVGFTLRKTRIRFESFLRRTAWLFDYFAWLLFSPEKFKSKPKEIKEILVVDTSALGDVINTLAIIRKIKRQNHGLNISLLVRADKLPVFKGEKGIRVISQEHLRNLEENYFDKGILIYSLGLKRPDLKKCKISFGAEYLGIFPSFRLRNFWVSRRIFPKLEHKIKERFRIFESAGFKFKDYKLYLESNTEEKIEAERFYKKLNLKNKERVVVFNPGAGTIKQALEKNLVPSHLWPFENWSRLADLLIEKEKVKILITGTKEESGLAGRITGLSKNKTKIKNLCGKISFLTLGEFLKKCNLVISIDTGTAHLAAQSGVKLIDLMGPMGPETYCAWNPSKKIETTRAITVFHKGVCNRCRKFYCPEKNPICMKSITPEEIYFLSKCFLNKE
jgi:ADP-heptose:LPS heptosyltransferase